MQPRRMEEEFAPIAVALPAAAAERDQFRRSRPPTMAAASAVSARVLRSARVELERLGEAPIRLQRVAVLAVAGRVPGARQEQPVAVTGRGAEIVFHQAETELLVV